MRRLALIFSLLQWSIFLILISVGTIAFLILCGQETPGQTISDIRFFGLKLIAGIVLITCIMAGKYFKRRGLLPELNDPEDYNWED